MQINLKQAVDFILQDEGPEFNRGGSEPGGGSKYGISLTVLQEVEPDATLARLGTLGMDDAGKIYETHILPTIRFDDLPAGVDYRMADIRTNLGLTGSINLLELVLGRWPLTGKLSDDMITSLQQQPLAMIYALSAAWIAKKHESPNWGPSAITTLNPVTKTGYGHGWSNRNLRATQRALLLLMSGGGQ